MEKYGVLEAESLAKIGEEKQPMACPRCGEKLRKKEHTNVLLCPRCGSAPFEGNDE